MTGTWALGAPPGVVVSKTLATFGQLDATIEAEGWDDDRVQELVQVLPDFAGLKSVSLASFDSAKGSEALVELGARGTRCSNLQERARR